MTELEIYREAAKSFCDDAMKLEIENKALKAQGISKAMETAHKNREFPVTEVKTWDELVSLAFMKNPRNGVFTYQSEETNPSFWHVNLSFTATINLNEY